MADNDGSGLRPQRRGRTIAMSDSERDAFLSEQRTCRVATVGPNGPHATPLWFAWDSGAIWLYSIVRSRRWAQLQADPRIGVVVDAGEDYVDLRGVEISGSVRVVGNVPRDDTPDGVVAGAEAEFSRKYMAGNGMFHDGRHGWLLVTPVKIVSWDFRKLGSAT